MSKRDVFNVTHSNVSNSSLTATTSSDPMSAIDSLVAQLIQHPKTFEQQNSQEQSGMPNTMQASLQSKMGCDNAAAGNHLLQGGLLVGGQGQAGGILSQGTTSQQQPSGSNPAAATTKDRHTIWKGHLDYQEEATYFSELEQEVHTLACTFSSTVNTSGNSDVNADRWPNQLVLQLIPIQVLEAAGFFNTFEAASRHVLNIHFSQESGALNILRKSMTSGLGGCIQFPTTCDIRTLVVLYMPSTQTYMGYIPHDQERLLLRVQIHEKHLQRRRQRISTFLATHKDFESLKPHKTNDQENTAQLNQSGDNFFERAFKHMEFAAKSSTFEHMETVYPLNPFMMTMMPQQPLLNNLNPYNQMNVCMPGNQQQPQLQAPQQVNPQQQQTQAPPQQAGMPHCTNANNQADAAHLNNVCEFFEKAYKGLGLLPKIPPFHGSINQTVNPFMMMPQHPVLNNPNPDNQMNVSMPVNQQQSHQQAPQQVNPQQQTQAPPQQAEMPHCTNANNQANTAQQNESLFCESDYMESYKKYMQYLLNFPPYFGGISNQTVNPSNVNMMMPKLKPWQWNPSSFWDPHILEKKQFMQKLETMQQKKQILLKMQQDHQTLEAAQQNELQSEDTQERQQAAQQNELQSEDTPEQQQAREQQRIERKRTVRHLEKLQLKLARQQRIQMQQVNQQQSQIHNTNLLQQKVPLTQPCKKCKPNDPDLQCAGTSSAEGTVTESPIVQERIPSVEENSLESQDSEIFHKDLVKKVMQKGERETGKHPNTLDYKEIGPKPEEKFLCKICFMQDLNVVFEPCLHMITCHGCSQSLIECPICRKCVTKKLRVYIS